MYRPLIIVGAFLAVTLGLIFFQPERTPPALVEPLEPLPLTPEPVVEVARAVNMPVALSPIEAEPDLSVIRPIARPEDLVPETRIPDAAPEAIAPVRKAAIAPPPVRPVARPADLVIPPREATGDVSREVAETPAARALPTVPEVAVAAPQTAPVEAPPVADTPSTASQIVSLVASAPSRFTAPPDKATEKEQLFSDLAESRPNLLTTTARSASGELLPSVNAGNASNARLAAQAPREIQTKTLAEVAALSRSVSTAQTGATAAARLALDGVTDVVATLPAPVEVGNAALRAQLMNAPTRAVHTVRLGDSLLTLALRYYGNAEKTEMILEANRRHLGDDGALKIGQVLRIPDIDDL